MDTDTDLATVSGYAFTRQPLTNVAPFTYRDGATFLNMLYGLVKFINEKHIPEINILIEEVEKIINDGAVSMNEQLVAAVAQFTQMITDEHTTNAQIIADFKAYVNGALADTTADITAEKVEWQTKWDAFMANVDLELQALNDAAMGTLIDNPTSATGSKLNGKFVGKNTLLVNVKDFLALGNGVADDVTQINAALNSATNVRLFFPSGEYRISGPITKTGGSVHIIGAPGAVIKPLDSYVGGAGRDLIRIVNPAGAVTIEGLTINGNSAALNGGAGFVDWTNYIGAITVLRTVAALESSVTIQNNIVYNFPSIAINATGGDNITIARNRVYNGMGHPIFVGRATELATSNVRILHNDCTGRGDVGTNPAIGGIGILVQRADFVTVGYNRIQNMGDTGTKTEGCNDVTYIGNEVTDSGKDGIKVQDYVPGNVFTVSRAKIIDNTVRRVNAWRTDGSGLIVCHSLKHAIIRGNLLEGGGTRLEDAIRLSILTAGNTFSNIIVEENNAINIASAGVRIYAMGTDQNTNVSVINNRLAGNIAIGSNANGDYRVAGNIVHNDGVLNTAVYGINVDKMMGGSVSIANNTVSDHLGGVFATLDGGAAVRSINIIGNIVRDVKDYGARIDNFNSTVGVLDVLEIVGNEFINTSADGTFKQSILRIGVGQLNIAFAKIQNIYRQIGAGTFNVPLQIIGSTYPIGYMDYSGNTVSGTFTSKDINGEPAVTRLKGYSKSQVPNWGTWEVGDYVGNSNPAEGGTAGAKYIIKGWTCVVAGSPGTWVQDRTLTGN